VNAVSLTRRIIVWVVVASFAIAAILGIAALLAPEFDETAWRVLSTTSVVGAFSVLVLCCASLLGRALRVFGLVGVAVSLITLVYAIWMIWWMPEWNDGWYEWYRILGTGVAVSIAFAVASLLLLLADRRRAAVRIGLWITLGLFALVLAMVIFVIWARDYDYEVVQRILGILSILAALGAIVVPVMSLLLKDDGAAVDPGHAPVVSAPVAERLRAEAARRGVTVDEFVTGLLDREPTA
jgi:MFS family permease